LIFLLFVNTSSTSAHEHDRASAGPGGEALPLNQLSSPTVRKQLRGGSKFPRRAFSRKKAWETAVKRGKGGFPGPMSWEPMDAEELRNKAENLLTPEVSS